MLNPEALIPTNSRGEKLAKNNTKSDCQNSLKIVILNRAKRHEGSLMIRREHLEILHCVQNDNQASAFDEYDNWIGYKIAFRRSKSFEI